MIDIHTHILPGFDDGPGTLEESLEMAASFVAAGFTAVVATPHVIPGVYDNGREAILEGVAALQKELDAEKIPLKVYPGSECHVRPDLPQDLADGKLVTLGDSGRYLLVELPAQEFPPYAGEVLFRLLLNGVTPVLAHPERSAFFSGSPRSLAELVGKGVLVQVTAGSLAGLFGPQVQRTARRWLREGLVHFVASDAHGNGHRLRAAARAAGLLGADAEALLKAAPAAAVRGCGLEPLAAVRRVQGGEEKKLGFLGRLFCRRR